MHLRPSIAKGAKIYNGENIVSSVSGAGKTGQLQFHSKQMKLEHSLTT